MPVGNYQYKSDRGDLYQVTVPSDFATALGMIPASGSEPYLDQAIQPRVATYFATGPVWRQVVVQSLLEFSRLPQFLVVSGLTYSLVNAKGEIIAPFQQGGITLAQGPIGPPGPAGPPGPGWTFVNADVLTDDYSYTIPGNLSYFNNLTTLNPGTYLMLASMTIVGDGVNDDQGELFAHSVLGSITPQGCSNTGIRVDKTLNSSCFISAYFSCAGIAHVVPAFSTQNHHATIKAFTWPGRDGCSGYQIFQQT